MTGPKTNEGATRVGENTGTRAVVKYVRSSAYKAREVLDLIRGLDVTHADQVLQFVERDIAHVIRKALASAVANAQNNDGQDPDELYVSACFSDEGPTLKRMRPRARGRAGAIRKRTCHITVLVARMPDSALARRRQIEAANPAAATSRRGAAAQQATSRRDRVARSKAKTEETHDHDHDGHDHAGHDHDGHDHDHDHDHDDAPATLVDTTASETAAVADAPYGEGSHAPLPGDEMPEGFEIKGNADSMRYHLPGTRYYAATIAEVWFATAEAAEAAGFVAPGGKKDDDAADEEGKA
jgi:large subunit ribosomal protein L22